MVSPWYSIGCACNDQALLAALRTDLTEFLSDEPQRVGFYITADSDRRPSQRPTFTIYDATGYRADRVTGLEEARRRMLSYLNPTAPVGVDPGFTRCYLDLRVAVRSGVAALIHPYLVDDVAAMVRLVRGGWELQPTVSTEIDLDTATVVLRHPLDPDDLSRPGAVRARVPIRAVVTTGEQEIDGPATMGAYLIRRHIDLSDGTQRRLFEALPDLVASAAWIPASSPDSNEAGRIVRTLNALDSSPPENGHDPEDL